MSLVFVVQEKSTNDVVGPYSKKISVTNVVKTKAADIKNFLDLKILSKFSFGFKELKSSTLSINPNFLPPVSLLKSIFYEIGRAHV